MRPCPCEVPTSQTSVLPEPHTFHRVSVPSTSASSHEVPVQCRTYPEPPRPSPLKSMPTVHTSSGEAAHTPRSAVSGTFDATLQAVPSQWRTLPPSPVAHTSFAPVPVRHVRFSVTPLGTSDHALPSKCTIVPMSPTAQTSRSLLPQMA